MKRFSWALSTLAILSLGTGCAAGGMHVAAPAPETEATAPVLDRSYFSNDGRGAIGEDDLQRVLSSPIDLVFPARVGVVPLAEPFDAAGKPTISVRSIASRHFASKLTGSPHFSHVSDVSTELPNVGGIEGLRAIAARYRLRYLVLYSERFEDDTHLNGWAWLYPTFVGMFVAPGVTVESHGLAQADLIDVRTGTVLMSAVEPMTVSSNELMIGAAREHREEQASAAADAAERLALRINGQVDDLLVYAAKAGAAERLVRILPAPIEPPTPTVRATLPAAVSAEAAVD